MVGLDQVELCELFWVTGSESPHLLVKIGRLPDLEDVALPTPIDVDVSPRALDRSLHRLLIAHDVGRRVHPVLRRFYPCFDACILFEKIEEMRTA